MHDFPTIDQLRAIGASPDAMRVLYGFMAYLGLWVLAGSIVWGIVGATARIIEDRRYLRECALDLVARSRK
ncbi:hypothetical protein [Xanthomonas sp. NCPPB 2632]|uniref:hypothetical protein n=1 Tax=Xanthomonas sp. NCPPB 2632 TaxID=3240912 RepID=UPI00351850C3